MIMHPEENFNSQNSQPLPRNEPKKVIQPLNPTDPELISPPKSIASMSSNLSQSNMHQASPIIPPTPESQPYSVPSIGDTGIQELPKKGFTTDNLIVILLVVFGGVGPGLILAGIYLLIKSFAKRDGAIRRTAIILMLVGAIVTGIMYYFFFSSKSQAVQVGNVQVQLQLPAGNKLVEQKPDYVIYGVPAAGSEELYAGQIILGKDMADKNVDISGAEQAIQSSSNEAAVKDQVSTFCLNPQISAAKKITVIGAQAAFQTDFICPKQSDGSEYGGYIVNTFTTTQATSIIVAAERELFEANSAQWDAVIPSIKITNK